MAKMYWGEMDILLVKKSAGRKKSASIASRARFALVRTAARLASMKQSIFVCLAIFAGFSCGGGGRGYYGSYADPCQRFASCGDCTPIRGCGWCSYGQSHGV